MFTCRPVENTLALQPLLLPMHLFFGSVRAEQCALLSTKVNRERLPEGGAARSTRDK